MHYSSDSVEALVEQFMKLPSIGRKTAQRLASYVLKMSRAEVVEIAKALVDVKDRVKNCSICFNVTDNDPCSICTSHRRDHSIICVVEDANDVMALERTNEYRGVYHVLGGVISPLDGIGPEDLHIRPLVGRINPEFRKLSAANGGDALSTANGGDALSAANGGDALSAANGGDALSGTKSDRAAAEMNSENPAAGVSGGGTGAEMNGGTAFEADRGARDGANSARSTVSEAAAEYTRGVEVTEVILALNPNVEGDTTAYYISQLLKPHGIRVTRIARGLPIGGDLEYADEATLSRAMEGRSVL